MSDPFATPTRAAPATPQGATPEGRTEGKLREVVNALNDVATARKNEAVALQQQLDQLAGAYSAVCREKDTLAEELAQARVLIGRLEAAAAANVRPPARATEVAEPVAPAAPPPAAAKAPAPAHAPAADPAARAGAALAARKKRHAPPSLAVVRAAGLCTAAVLFLVSMGLGGATEAGTIPRHLALVRVGDPSRELVMDEAVADPLYGAAAEHVAEHFTGGAVALLGELIEAGHAVSPPKTWRAVAALCDGLAPGDYPNAGRNATDASAAVAAQCWACDEVVWEGESAATWLLRLALQLGFLATCGFYGHLVLAKVKEMSGAGEAEAGAAAAAGLPEHLPMVMMPAGAEKTLTAVWAAEHGGATERPLKVDGASPRGEALRWCEVTLQFDDADAAPPLPAAAVRAALLGGPVPDLQTVYIGASLTSGAVREVVFDQSHSGAHTLAAADPIGASAVVPGDKLVVTSGRPTLWVNAEGHLLAERNANEGTRYKTVAPGAYALRRGRRQDAYAEREGVLM
eukprot:TRINITY_DN16374_c0_g1_i3.p1 TRINITY_DN16374_c0_g1~~TRINITY_DN16374_c0_g1_i3.p1  ORF type:complete len:517 (+),score=165.82 TRINITY_DN16374_c0_g1_i3:39-1589(+)